MVWFATFATEAEEVAQTLNPGNEVRSVHFLPLLSITGSVKGFMARIRAHNTCADTHTSAHLWEEAMLNTYAKGSLVELFSCNPLH